MKTQKKNAKRITLSRTTLRRLGSSHLAQVVGGARDGDGGDILIFDIIGPTEWC
jgi:hypothetical protein